MITVTVISMRVVLAAQMEALAPAKQLVVRVSKLVKTSAGGVVVVPKKAHLRSVMVKTTIVTVS